MRSDTWAAARWWSTNHDAAENQYGRRYSSHLRIVGAFNAAESVCGVSPDPTKRNSAWGKVWTFFQTFHASDPYYELIFLSLIVFFTFFYVSIVFNVEEVADNLRKHGGFMPGIRPGRLPPNISTASLPVLTVVGAVYLALVAFVPQFMLSGFKVARLPLIGGWLDQFVSGTPGSVLDSNRYGLSVLLWRHLVADSRRRRYGYGCANRSPACHAKLRRLPGGRRTAAWTTSLSYFRLPSIANCELTQAN